MFPRKFLLSTSVISLLLLLSVQSVSASSLTWHSSVKEGNAWKWKVTNISGDLETYFGTFFNDTEDGYEIEVRVVGNPPTDGNWSTIVDSSSIIWAELYINGTQSIDESIVFFFVAPVDIGNGVYGWEERILLFYSITSFLGFNFYSSNSSSGNLITYHCGNYGGFGSLQFSVTHTFVYDSSTGILNRYTLDFSTPSLTSSISLVQIGGGELEIPGFEIETVGFGILFLISIPIVRRRK